MSVKKESPKKRLTGPEIIAKLKKHGYSGMTDHEIKKTIGGGKIATVSQLREELKKLEKGSPTKKRSPSKKSPKSITIKTSPKKTTKSSTKKKTTKSPTKKKATKKSSKKSPSKKKATPTKGKKSRERGVIKKLEKGTLIAAALMAGAKHRGESCENSKAVLIWNKKDWELDQSRPTIAIIGTSDKKIETSFRDYLILHRDLESDMSDDDFEQVLEILGSFSGCAYSPKLNSVYEIRCVKAFNTTPQTFTKKKKPGKEEVYKNPYTSKEITEFVLKHSGKKSATKTLPPYLRKKGELKEIEEFKPRTRQPTKTLAWAVPGKRLEKKYKPAERRKEKFIEPESTESEEESSEEEMYPLMF